MLYVFGFARLAVVLSDLYFLDPEPDPGQEGAERGVRLELRVLDQLEQDGTIYASRPIVVGRPLWRVDLLESLSNPGSLDRAHHHPRMRGWEPGGRRFDRELTVDPIGWLGRCLAEVNEVADVEGIGAEDLDELRGAVPEILDAARRLLDRIADGQLARPPAGAESAPLIRAGWL